MNSSLNTISNWQEAVFVAAVNIFTQFFNFLPSLFGALLIFVIGLILAKWAKTIIVKVLSAVKLDKVLKKIGLEPFLTQADIKLKSEVIIGETARWLIIIVFFMAGVNVLGLSTVGAVLASVLNFVPSIVSAVLILTVGVLLAGLVEGLIKGAVNQIDPKTGRLLSKVASYLVVIVAALAAINELGIAQSLINILFIGIITTLALGIGLAIGLGAKDLVSKMLMDWYAKGKKK
ncbi:MAG: hypothetical protein U0946_03565 [Patescibacteria group bacterium]|nr:hypothetical protein [Patescibacteria group bacterium]